MEKKCKECQINKEIDDKNFHKRKGSKDGYDSYCLICRRKRNLSNYHKNQQNWRNTHTKTRLEKKEKIQEIKKTKFCLKCGEKRHYVLDFHHTEPKNKTFQISQGEGRGWKAIEEEMDKCLVLCKNCHAEFHHFEKINKITIKEYLIQN